MTNPFLTNALVPAWYEVGLLKASEQSKHHKSKAEYHRRMAQALTARGFLYPASLHIQAAVAHDNAAKLSEDNSGDENATEDANDASSAAESASAAVSTGFTSDAGGAVSGGDAS